MLHAEGVSTVYAEVVSNVNTHIFKKPYMFKNLKYIFQNIYFRFLNKPILSLFFWFAFNGDIFFSANFVLYILVM